MSADIFVIQSLRLDPTENDSDKALTYETLGYVESEPRAKEICSKAGYADPKDCWAVALELKLKGKLTPNKKYEKVKLIFS